MIKRIMTDVIEQDILAIGILKIGMMLAIYQLCSILSA